MDFELYFDGDTAEKMRQDLIASDDGFYYYNIPGEGMLSSWDLRRLATLIDWVNEPLEKELDEFFAQYLEGSGDDEQFRDILFDDDYVFFFGETETEEDQKTS